jgi:hypothetical protein
LKTGLKALEDSSNQYAVFSGVNSPIDADGMSSKLIAKPSLLAVSGTLHF